MKAASGTGTLSQHISRIVAAAPPLTPEQRDRIAALLGGRAS